MKKQLIVPLSLSVILRAEYSLEEQVVLYLLRKTPDVCYLSTVEMRSFFYLRIMLLCSISLGKRCKNPTTEQQGFTLPKKQQNIKRQVSLR